MSTDTEQSLREALAFDPQTPSLSAEPIIATVQRQHRRSMWVGAVAASAVLAAGGVAVATWPGDTTTFAVPAGVTQVSDTIEIGSGWQMVVDGDGLCLTDEAGTESSCGVNLAFQEGNVFSWSSDASGPRIYAWVVRDGTATASLESPARAIAADVYRVSALDVSIAVAQDLPQDVSGWARISRDETGALTDSVPFHAEQDLPTQDGEDFPTQG